MQQMQLKWKSKKLTITRLKSWAAETVEETNQVINKCVENLTQACQGLMPLTVHYANLCEGKERRSEHTLLILLILIWWTMVILELMKNIFFLVTVVMFHAELLYLEGNEVQRYQKNPKN